MLNGRIYNFTLKKFKIKCLLILQKKNNNKMSINNYHNYHNSYFEKKKILLYNTFMCIAWVIN